MRLTHLGIIGAGSITQEMLAVLSRTLPAPLGRISILVRPGRAAATQAIVAAQQGRAAHDFQVVEGLDAFIAAAPGLVLEAAGHEAVAVYGPALLQAGIETVIVSTGALSDPDLYRALKRAAIAGNTRLVLAAGAVGAMDILAGLSHADIKNVTYTSRKPPSAWVGTKADALLDLPNLDHAAQFFEGSARAAARDYPKNANVAASIALAGVGFDRTEVRMVADPSVTENIHTFDVSSDAAEMSVRIVGKPSQANPKTSLPTVYSLVREVMRRVSPIVS